MSAPITKDYISYRNQKIIHINRDMPKKDEANFLTIKKKNFYDTYRAIKHTATMLYLYLAANKDGYKLSFSENKVLEEMGMPTSTCSDQLKKLIKNGYLVPQKDSVGVYDFYERPMENFEKITIDSNVKIKTIHIHRDMPKENESNFLLIKKENLFNAYRRVGHTAMILYLYLAGNADGFNLALSPKAVQNEIGYPEATCRKQIQVLIDKKYLVLKKPGSNIFEFFEKTSSDFTAQTCSTPKIIGTFSCEKKEQTADF